MKKLSDVDAAPTISAIEALRRNLRWNLLNEITGDDMREIAKVVTEKAKAGDLKAVKMVNDMISGPESGPSVSVRNSFNVEGSVIDAIVKVREQIAHLIRFCGPKATEEVAQRLNLNGEITMRALQCDWFERDNGKWHLNAPARNFLEEPARIAAETE
jgi:hypothetical protein